MSALGHSATDEFASHDANLATQFNAAISYATQCASHGVSVNVDMDHRTHGVLHYPALVRRGDW